MYTRYITIWNILIYCDSAKLCICARSKFSLWITTEYLCKACLGFWDTPTCMSALVLSVSQQVTFSLRKIIFCCSRQIRRFRWFKIARDNSSISYTIESRKRNFIWWWDSVLIESRTANPIWSFRKNIREISTDCWKNMKMFVRQCYDVTSRY